MEKILFLDACVRKESRTRRLADELLKHLNGTVIKVRLCEEELKPLDGESLSKRAQMIEKGDLSGSEFSLARQFASSDTIVLAAPYWNLSFPALVKLYFDRILVAGVTFRYTESGQIQSLCSVKKICYVFTSGGEAAKPNTGAEWLRQVFLTFFQVADFQQYFAENLDLWNTDANEIMEKAEKEYFGNSCFSEQNKL